MSSVFELEERSAVERKRLMQSLFDHLTQMGIKVELQPEPAVNYLAMKVLDSVIYLKEQNLNKIRLKVTDGSSCGVSSGILRFQYEVNLDQELTGDKLKNISAATEVIKEGKLISIFGGKVVGIKWVGKALANKLNQDKDLSDHLMQCVGKWSGVEFKVEAVSPKVVYIFGPRFSNPDRIVDLYSSKDKEDIQCCIFGFNMVNRIAGYVKTIV